MLGFPATHSLAAPPASSAAPHAQGAATGHDFHAALARLNAPAPNDQATAEKAAEPPASEDEVLQDDEIAEESGSETDVLLAFTDEDIDAADGDAGAALSNAETEVSEAALEVPAEQDGAHGAAGESGDEVAPFAGLQSPTNRNDGTGQGAQAVRHEAPGQGRIGPAKQNGTAPFDGAKPGAQMAAVNAPNGAVPADGEPEGLPPRAGTADGARIASRTAETDRTEVKAPKVQSAGAARIAAMTVIGPMTGTFDPGAAMRDGPAASAPELAQTGDYRAAPLTAPEARGAGAGFGNAPALARHVAVQIAEGAARGAERPIELTLSPAELGRVRITLTAGEGGMVVNVGAERAETLDLMRRHIDLLGDEFQDLGYGATNFTFSQEERAGRQSDRAAFHAAVPLGQSAEPELAPAPTQALQRVLSERVDIRL